MADQPLPTGPTEEAAPNAADAPVAARLAEAHRRLAELGLAGTEAARLHRQFIAVCDAVKAAAADDAAAERRMTAFMAALDRAERERRGPGAPPPGY